MKMILFIVGIIFSANISAQEKSIPEQLAQQQLDAYNKRDMEAFLKPYSDSVQVFMFPNQLMYQGKETMRQQYAGMFSGTPDLFCKLKNRMVVKNTVIDHEQVTFDKKRPAMEAIAIYTIEKDKIVKVHFIMPQ
jgi:hypothetical protein